jgi:carbamoyl-phosphate synthase large subunit
MAKIASRLMTGRKLREFLPENIERRSDLDTGSNYYVKSPVFPWNKFPGVDTVLGPEMRSTGEVMGVADNFGEAFAKAQLSAGQKLPTQGTVFISVNEQDKPNVAMSPVALLRWDSSSSPPTALRISLKQQG